MRQVALTENAAFTAGDPDLRGGRATRAATRRSRCVNGQVPAPFVDADGDGLPDVDALGRFVTSDGSLPPSPFFSVDGASGPRDSSGRALSASGNGALVYGYVGVHRTFGAALARDVRPFFQPDPDAGAARRR